MALLGVTQEVGTGADDGAFYPVASVEVRIRFDTQMRRNAVCTIDRVSVGRESVVRLTVA